MPTRRPRPTEVGETLTRLREALELTAADVAARATAAAADPDVSITQPTLSRWENGRGYPDRKQTDALLEVLGADPETAARLRSLARGPQQRRVVLHRHGAPRTQREWRDLERSSTRVVTFTPTVVPGLLQTDAYATALVGEVLTPATREQWLAARRERRALVDDPGDREIVQITTAGALLWGLGGPDVMREQIAHLADVARSSRVRLGVVPPATTVGFVALGGFDLYDTPSGRRVVVGTEAAVAVYDDAGDVALHEEVLAGLESAAAWGADAVPVLEELARAYG